MNDSADDSIDIPKREGFFRIDPRFQLIGLSFLALFLELMLIRWVPSSVRLVAYFANLLLISSFLGLGLGALVRSRGWNLFRFFPLMLVLSFAYIQLCHSVLLPSSPIEFRFVSYAASREFINYFVLIGIFIGNVLVFVPIGEKIGELFHAMPALKAYSWDLGGSLIGTIFFGLFSFFAFSPLIGMIVVVLVYLVVSEGRNLGRAGLAFLILFAILISTVDPRAIWSPYYYISVHQQDGSIVDLSDVSPTIRTELDPEPYFVRVNQDFYQSHRTIDLARLTPNSPQAQETADWRANYFLPYRFKKDPGHVLVLGSGGGTDVEAAILKGARKVTAVDIDPFLIELSRRINGSGIYDDARVDVINDDGRAFIQRTKEKYDLIVFGLLDSQALFSSLSNVRLDGFIYTKESIRTAFSRLDEDGVLSVTFSIPENNWLAHKLALLLTEATGEEPVIYWKKGGVVLLAFRDPPVTYPPEVEGYQRITEFTGDWTPEIPTDDWPYLYLIRKGINFDYLVVIATLLVFSIFSVLFLTPKGSGKSNRHFFFLGLGFLLLQTKSITDCSLYFGATWFVTTLVITGVLLMVFLANYVADRYVQHFRMGFYLPLIASLMAIFFTPTDAILALPFWARMAWVVLAVPLPVFFAGLIFSTTFRTSSNPSANLGANLIGATIGGFLEYLGMAIGHNYLVLIIVVAYLLSGLCMRGAATDAEGLA
jgi:SAM-dependent methyltransferase